VRARTFLLPEAHGNGARSRRVLGRGSVAVVPTSRTGSKGDADPSSSPSAAALSVKAGPQLFAARLRLILSEQHQDGRGDVAPEHEPCEGPAERHPMF
jgi:hypothetical protein